MNTFFICLAGVVLLFSGIMLARKRLKKKQEKDFEELFELPFPRSQFERDQISEEVLGNVEEGVSAGSENSVKLIRLATSAGFDEEVKQIVAREQASTILLET